MEDVRPPRLLRQKSKKMYCNKCGKELPKESLYCPYCGGKQEAFAFHNIYNNINKKEKRITETDIKTKTKASSVADEIIANLKMIGIAVILSIIYLSIFWISHTDDKRHITDLSEYGISCYDEVAMQYFETDWEIIYNEIHDKRNKQIIQKQIRDQQFSQRSSPEIRRRLEELDKILENAPGSELINVSEEELIKMAKEKASSNLQYMINRVNDRRDTCFHDDFINHIKYSIIISLVITIMGRYLIKGIKWVVANKT